MKSHGFRCSRFLSFRLQLCSSRSTTPPSTLGQFTAAHHGRFLDTAPGHEDHHRCGCCYICIGICRYHQLVAVCLFPPIRLHRQGAASDMAARHGILHYEAEDGHRAGPVLSCVEHRSSPDASTNHDTQCTSTVAVSSVSRRGSRSRATFSCTLFSLAHSLP